MKKHVTVVPVDHVVIVDGMPLFFDFPAPENLHAIQWHNGAGHIEFADDGSNVPLAEGDYEGAVAPYVAMWEKENARIEAERNRPRTTEELAAAARAERDALLSSTDYLMMPDYPVSKGTRAAVTDYRQALRDVTGQEGFPENVIWPEKPEGV